MTPDPGAIRLDGKTEAEVLAAFKVSSTAGLVASADDRHLIAEACRLVAEGGR